MDRLSPIDEVLVACALVGLVAAGCGSCEEPRGASAGDASAPSPEGGVEADGGGGQEARAPVAEVVRVVGDVRFRAAESVAWSPARRDLALRPADAVQTMANGLADLRFLRSGGLARLGPSTTLRVPDQAVDVARLNHLRGPLVARLGQGGELRRMEVELPAGTLVLDAPASRTEPRSGADAGEETRVEAHVDVSDERTEVAMLKGEGTLARRTGERLRIEEEHFVKVAGDGELLDSGRIGPLVELVSPADGETVRTRQDVRLEWARADGADAYRVVVTPESGEPLEVSVPSGQASAAVELPSGRHLWTVHAVVDGTPARALLPRAVVVDLDRSPPLLEVASPAPGAAIRGATLDVSGRTEPGATVTVDGRAVDVAPDGSFQVAHPVPRGLVNIVIRATDDLGNARAVSRAVLRE